MKSKYLWALFALIAAVLVCVSVDPAVVAMHIAAVLPVDPASAMIGLAALGHIATDPVTRGDLEAAFLEQQKEIKKAIEKAEGEVKETGKMSVETKAAVEGLATKGIELGKRLDSLEAALQRKLDDDKGGIKESIGAMFVKDDGFKAILARRDGTARMKVDPIQMRAAIVNATLNGSQPLVAPSRVPGIIMEPNRRLTVRDLLPVGRTQSNLIYFAKENVYTNSAGPQYDASPGTTEGALKNESGITFTLGEAPVVTLAHWIPVSKQVLDDAPMLQSYIDQRLMYGLKLEEEDELLNGTGSAGTLNGLMNQATAYNRGATGDTRIDTLRKSITQGQLSEYAVSGFVLNPADWESVELTKDSQGRYIIGDPNSLMSPRIWANQVVATNSMPSGQFLAGAFDLGAQIWDREEANVAISFEDRDNFIRNMATLRAEERLALTVYRAQAFVKGSF